MMFQRVMTVLVAVVVLSLDLAWVASAGVEPLRPNVVVILVDDLRFDALGCTGHPFAKTPHIDRIAREGARFQNAFVTTPLCSPSRASFLTGRYVHSHQVRGNGNNNALSHELVTFPMLLQKAGYETAFIGKWHMGNDDSPRAGFDLWVSFKGQGRYVDPELNVNGKASQADGYMTDLLGDRAVAFVRGKHAQPFLLYLAHKAVHGPFTSADRHKDLYSDDSIAPPPSARDSLKGKPILLRRIDAPALKAETKDRAKAKAKAKAPGGGGGVVRSQLRTLQAVDEGVGRLFQALEETRQLDNTLVVFTSDNGYFWGEHGLGDKRAAYEESIRIPLLMRLPSLIKPGTSIDQLVLNVDLAPTLLELGGAGIPESLHGRSLVSILKGTASDWRSAFLAEYFAEAAYPRIPTWQAVRTRRWKFINYTDLEGMDELYDLQSDRYELKNLIHEPSSQAVLKELRGELDRQVKQTP